MTKFRKLLALFLFFAPALSAGELNLSPRAESAILINAKTGEVLFSKNAHERCFPASTTKIATALYSLHLIKGRVERKMTATQEAIASITPQAKKQSHYRSPPYWLETDGTHVGIKKGEVFPFHDLLYAMLVASANDACNVVAQNLCKTIPKFMEELNAFLKELGCKNTTFNNPHGLHHPDHMTTAYDFALVAKEAMKNPFFRKVVSTVRYTCPKTNLEEERTFLQTNLLLRKGAYHYEKAIGIKTGTTSAAGKNLVAAAEDENRSLIAVVFGYRGSRDELYQDIIEMFDTAFKEKKFRKQFLQKGEQKLTKPVKGAKGSLKTYLEEGLFYDFYPSEEKQVKVVVEWDPLILPITMGQKVGFVRTIDQKGSLLSEKPLFAATDLHPTLCHKLFQQKKGRQILFYSLAGLFLLSFILLKKRRLTF